MNKVSSTGLNFISRNVKENIEQTKSIQKEIVNIQQEALKDTSSLGKSFVNCLYFLTLFPKFFCIF